MTRCTVCGAASREGAKFCTSCGTPLVDETVEQDAAPASIATGRDADPVESSASADSDAEPTSAPSATSDGDDAAASDNRASDPATSARGGGQYVSSWPDAETAGNVEGADPQADRSEESATSSREASAWPGTANDDDDARSVTAPAPESFATDAYQDPGESAAASREGSAWPSASADDDDEDEDAQVFTAARDPSATDSDVDQELDRDTSAQEIDDHHGPSDWEGWAPMASGPSTASIAFDEHVAIIGRMADDLKRHVERITRPADLASRALDPDDLADQLERWSRALTNSDDLFEIVQQVRRSPRDVDAMIRLADHAADLELLVRHYQSITSTSDQWAADLRRTREHSSDR